MPETGTMENILFCKNDLDLNNQEWTPIGNARKPFKGNFDGNNHTVTGMKISGALDCVGLFGGCTRHNVYSAMKKILQLRILIFTEKNLLEQLWEGQKK